MSLKRHEAAHRLARLHRGQGRLQDALEGLEPVYRAAASREATSTVSPLGSSAATCPFDER